MNWEPINQLVEGMKPRTEMDGEVLFANLRECIAIAEDNYSRGWPASEIIFDSPRPTGIPIELAAIVYLVFQFAADHDIDLADSIKTAALESPLAS